MDQYRVKVDKRSGIKNDPNREEDAKYILRLIGQVIYSQFRDGGYCERFTCIKVVGEPVLCAVNIIVGVVSNLDRAIQFSVFSPILDPPSPVGTVS